MNKIIFPDYCEAEIIKHGHWIRSLIERSPKFVNGYFYERKPQNIAHCSVCKQGFAVGNANVEFEYCPHCGAKMDEEV